MLRDFLAGDKKSLGERLLYAGYHSRNKIKAKLALIQKKEIPFYTLGSISSSFRLPVLAVCSFKDLRLGPGIESALPNPFFLAAEALCEGKQNEAFEIVELFYSRVTFQSWGDFLGCARDEDSTIHQFSPLAEVWPWSKITQEETAVNDYKRAIDREFKKYGRISDQDYPFYFGPVSSQKIAWDIDRLHSVINSIRKNGYIRSNGIDGDVSGWLLLYQGERVVHIHGGIHRIAALWAFGYKEIVVRIDGVFDHSHMSQWQAIKDGTYSQELTTQVFMNMCKTRCVLEDHKNSWLTESRMDESCQAPE